jgi:hypothetical protein
VVDVPSADDVVPSKMAMAIANLLSFRIWQLGGGVEGAAMNALNALRDLSQLISNIADFRLSMPISDFT